MARDEETATDHRTHWNEPRAGTGVMVFSPFPHSVRLPLFIFGMQRMRASVLVVLLAIGASATSANAQVDAFGRRIDGQIRLSPPMTAPKPRMRESSPKVGDWELLPFVERGIPIGADALAIGDVTGDGRPDVVVTTLQAFDPARSFHLFLFTQAPDGTLMAPVKYPYSQIPTRTSVVVLDVDGEHGDDVVVGGYTGLTVFRATAAGELTPSAPVASQDIRVMVAVDLNGSGPEDLVSTSYASGGYLHLNQGNGSFLSSPWAVHAEERSSMARGDLDADGRVDVALATTYPGGITLYRNTGSGLALMQSLALTARCPAGFDISPGVSGVGIGDVNGDGRADVVAAAGGNRPHSIVQVFLAAASGQFAPPVCYESYDIPETLRVADINSDGLDDVVVLHGGWEAMGVYLQLGDGTLANERLFELPYASHYTPHGMEIADLTGDGCPDVFIAEENHGLVTLQGAQCGTAPDGIDEPGSSHAILPTPNPANPDCPSGFFTATVGDGPGVALTSGTFGMELLLDDPGTRILAGGLNFGGLLDVSQPGFAGFAIANAADEMQRVTLSLTGSDYRRITRGISVQVRISRRTATTSTLVFETTGYIDLTGPRISSIDLTPGFYEVTVTPVSGNPGGAAEGQFFLSLTTSFIDRPGGGFQGGAVVGGYHAWHPFGGVSGFAGFCLATPHSASVRVLSAPTYGGSGARDLRLRILNAQGGTLVAVPGD